MFFLLSFYYHNYGDWKQQLCNTLSEVATCVADVDCQACVSSVACFVSVETVQRFVFLLVYALCKWTTATNLLIWSYVP